MFKDLPQHIINYIYTFDNTYKKEYDKVVKEIDSFLLPFSHIEYENDDKYSTIFETHTGNLVGIVKKR